MQNEFKSVFPFLASGKKSKKSVENVKPSQSSQANSSSKRDFPIFVLNVSEDFLQLKIQVKAGYRSENDHENFQVDKILPFHYFQSIRLRLVLQIHEKQGLEPEVYPFQEGKVWAGHEWVLSAGKN